MYTKGAYHLKAFSVLKINCGVQGSGDERVNRQHMKVLWHKSEERLIFKWSKRSAQSTFSSLCILFPVPSICTFPFVFLCPCSSSPPPRIFPFKDTVKRGQGVGGRRVRHGGG